MRVNRDVPTTNVTIVTLVAVITTGSIVIGGCANGNEDLRVKGQPTQTSSESVVSSPRPAKGTEHASSENTPFDVNHGEPTSASRVKDAKGLDIYTITRFDLLLKERCWGITGLDIRYSGPLSRGRLGQMVRDSIEDYLEWQIVGRSGLVVCQLSISLAKSEATVVECEIEGRKLYVSVDYVSDPATRSLADSDTPIAEVSGMTIREFLKPLESN